MPWGKHLMAYWTRLQRNIDHHIKEVYPHRHMHINPTNLSYMPAMTDTHIHVIHSVHTHTHPHTHSCVEQSHCSHYVAIQLHTGELLGCKNVSFQITLLKWMIYPQKWSSWARKGWCCLSQKLLNCITQFHHIAYPLTSVCVFLL